MSSNYLKFQSHYWASQNIQYPLFNYNSNILTVTIFLIFPTKLFLLKFFRKVYRGNTRVSKGVNKHYKRRHLLNLMLSRRYLLSVLMFLGQHRRFFCRRKVSGFKCSFDRVSPQDTVLWIKLLLFNLLLFKSVLRGTNCYAKCNCFLAVLGKLVFMQAILSLLGIYRLCVAPGICIMFRLQFWGQYRTDCTPTLFTFFRYVLKYDFARVGK